MILVNNTVWIHNTMDLNEFVELLNGQIYNDESQMITDCIVDFLYEVWERDQKLTHMLHKKVADHLFPVVAVDIEETADFTKLDISAVSTNKEYEPTKADDIAFNEFCERYFKTLKPLYNRFADLKLN